MFKRNLKLSLVGISVAIVMAYIIKYFIIFMNELLKQLDKFN